MKYKAERKYWKLESGELRPNRTAAGMSVNLKRSGKDPVLVRPHVLTLAVRGTLDKLGSFNSRVKVQTIYRYGISDRGKARLNALRARVGVSL